MLQEQTYSIIIMQKEPTRPRCCFMIGHCAPMIQPTLIHLWRNTLLLMINGKALFCSSCTRRRHSSSAVAGGEDLLPLPPFSPEVFLKSVSTLPNSCLQKHFQAIALKRDERALAFFCTGDKERGRLFFIYGKWRGTGRQGCITQWSLFSTKRLLLTTHSDLVPNICFIAIHLVNSEMDH